MRFHCIRDTSSPTGSWCPWKSAALYQGHQLSYTGSHWLRLPCIRDTSSPTGSHGLRLPCIRDTSSHTGRYGLRLPCIRDTSSPTGSHGPRLPCITDTSSPTDSSSEDSTCYANCQTLRCFRATVEEVGLYYPHLNCRWGRSRSLAGDVCVIVNALFRAPPGQT